MSDVEDGDKVVVGGPGNTAGMKAVDTSRVPVTKKAVGGRRERGNVYGGGKYGNKK